MKTIKEIREQLSAENLPDEMRNMTDEMRQKVTETSDSLLELGYKAPIAATMAVERVRSWSNLSDEPLPYHVIPYRNGWAVMKADADKATVVTETKQGAVDQGREIARNQKGKLIIHGEDGMVQEEHSYEQA
jgi:uncharacterized protein YdaT